MLLVASISMTKQQGAVEGQQAGGTENWEQ
jgi:hypothetical protein